MQDDLQKIADLLRNRYFGKYRGEVTDNQDPAQRGRLKVRVPAVLGNEEFWAMPCVPYAGTGTGSYCIPSPNTGVWVEFEGGDPSYPIWSGCYWADGELPPDTTGEADPDKKILHSEQGLVVSLDDSANEINIGDVDGNNLLTVSVNAGQVKILASSKVIVEAPMIELVEGAPHPLVFGDSLLQYFNQLINAFNTHMHVGETAAGIPVSPAPPSLPATPPTPQILSTKVKTG